MKNDINTAKVRGGRNSSVELFRIVAMLFVLICHFNGWFLGGISDIHDSTVSLEQRIGQTFIQSCGLVCVNCFIIISGWFGLKFTFMRVWRMWAILVCLIIPFDILSLFVCSNATFKITTFIRDFCAFPAFSYYIQDYMLLMFFSPLFNLFINKYREKALGYALMLWMIEFGLESIFNCDTVFINNGYSLFHFILMYLLSRSLYFHQDKLKMIGKKKWIALYMSCALLISFLSLTPYEHTWGYSNPIAIIESFALFFFFLSFHFHSRKVNWIASSTFAVFILHCQSPIINVCRKVDNYVMDTYSYGQYLLIIGFFIIIVFFFCISIDKLRIYFVNPYFEKIGSCLNSKLSKYFIYDN